MTDYERGYLAGREEASKLADYYDQWVDYWKEYAPQNLPETTATGIARAIRALPYPPKDTRSYPFTMTDEQMAKATQQRET